MTEKEQTLYDLFGFQTIHINYLINISEKYKYIYFETPKVGCSTIKRTLQKLEVENSSKIPKDVHNKTLSPLLSPLQLENNFTEYLTDEYFKFSFVRNPYTRILSCYLDKIIGTPETKKVFLPTLGFEPTANISFKEFLLTVKQQSYAEMNNHWKPQSILLATENITLDFIGRQENFDNDLKRILAKITKDDPDPLQISNERPHAVGANKKIQQYITEDIAKLIQEIYYDDFYLYGYSTDPFNTDPLPNLSKHLVETPSTPNDLVSIIIPCYNQVQYLEEAVQSATDQTYPNIEIIIVNDGSSDNTLGIAEGLQKKHPNLIRVVTQENKGLSEARNAGIRESLGEYILPLDADDKIDKRMVSKCIKALIHNNSDLISTDTQCFGKETYKIVPVEFPECNLLYRNCWVVASMFRRKVWIETGGYKKNMIGGYEDWEFWINAYKHGFKFRRYPEVLFYYRTKETSMFTTAQSKDRYLKSKLIMNNPELYPIPQVHEAVNCIKETEELPDLYFYNDKYMPDNKKMWLTEIGHYISNNPLESRQIIQIDNQKVGLYTLDMIENSTSLEELYKQTDVDFIIFYAPLRYEMETLSNCEYAWKKDKGIIQTNGSIFTFVPKVKRECPEKQLIAYQHLVQFQEMELNTQQIQITKKEHMLEDKKITIEKQNKVIKDKVNLLQKKDEEISQADNRLNTLLNTIQKITEFSIKKHPIHKYKAYKVMLKTYYQLKSSK